MSEPLLVKVEYNDLGIVTGYVCPNCHGPLKLNNEDDVGTKFYKCQKCGEISSYLKPESKIEFEKDLQAYAKEIEEIQRPTTLEEISDVLNSTIKHDEQNKTITFLSMLLTYTNEDQISIGYAAESSSGKSYIPLELAWYFPKSDVLEYGYVSPTAFFHEFGIMLPDPRDTRDVEPKKKQKIIYIDLCQKILIFMDQPHALLLERLRPLLSHDRKEIEHKITDRSNRSGLRTKRVVIQGYPTVIFCTAKPEMKQQERTRLLLLSPETTAEKIRAAIMLKIEKESNRDAFRDYMDEDPTRKWLKLRVEAIKKSDVKQVVIPEDKRAEIADKFFEDRNTLIPRHQRDISRLIGMIKAHALLNLWHRENTNNSVIINSEDIIEGFRLYNKISLSNEMGLPPEIYRIYEALKPRIPQIGLTKKAIAVQYYEAYRRPIGKKRLDNIITMLESAGLLREEKDSNDGRVIRYYLADFDEKINTPEGVTTLDSASATTDNSK